MSLGWYKNRNQQVIMVVKSRPCHVLFGAATPYGNACAIVLAMLMTTDVYFANADINQQTLFAASIGFISRGAMFPSRYL